MTILMADLMRLDRYLSQMRVGSRKEVRLLVRSGRVRINGVVTKESATKVQPKGQIITVDEQEIKYMEFIYLMLNKPDGYLSTTRDRRGRTVLDLLPAEWEGWDLFPVGRLDKDTEGLLLLTNDGPLAHRLLAPKSHVPKLYYVQIKGKISREEIGRLEVGLRLTDGYITKPALVRILHNATQTDALSEVELTIYEGKFHQVKRMFTVLGKEVVYLKRLAMGDLKLDPDLKKGEVRELTEEEVKLLK